MDEMLSSDLSEREFRAAFGARGYDGVDGLSARESELSAVRAC